MKDQNVTYFTPMIEKFGSDVRNKITETNLEYTHALMLPHLVSPEHYKGAKKHFFYLGQDTRFWMEADHEIGGNAFENMIEWCISGRTANYLDVNNYWPGKNTINKLETDRTQFKERIFAWGNAHTFWPAVIKLQIFLNTEKYLDDIWTCTEKDIDCLLEMGYGNIYSVELASSLYSEGWKKLPKEYDFIRTASASFDKLKHILDLYKPDFIIVFCWNWDEDYYFGDIEIKQKEDIDQWAIYSFKGYKTKMICTRHPRCFDRYQLGYPGFDEMIKRTGKMILDRI